MFSQDLVEKIKAQVDIVELISEYLPLKKSGNQYKGLCPFHIEKTPSFSVSQNKQAFHCFGCGEGGSIFTFVMKMEHLDFPESVRFLAEKAGISIREMSYSPAEQKAYEEKQEIYKMYEEACVFYQNILNQEPGSNPAREYLVRRKMEKGTIENFKLGYAPAQGKRLLEYFKGKGFSIEIIKKSGLVIFSQYHKDWVDAFKGRLLFPIINTFGKVIAFGGRALDESVPKYLNSPETPIYTKGSHLYGLYQGRDAIQKQEKALIVEGYFDVIACHQAGFSWAVASLGTALTEGQIKLLKKYTRQVVLMYDSDDAGITAAKRSGNLLIEQGMRPRFVVLKDAKDPDEYLKKFTSQDLEKSLQSSTSFVDFYMDLFFGQEHRPAMEEKLKILDILFPILEKVENKIEQDELLKIISARLDLTKEILSQGFSNLSKVKRDILSHASAKESKLPAHPAQKELVMILLCHPEYASEVMGGISADELLEDLYQKIFMMMEKSFKEQGSLDIAQITASFEQDTVFMQEFSRKLLEENKYKDVGQALKEVVLKLKGITQQKIKSGLKLEISEAEKNGDQEKFQKLLNEYKHLLTSQN